DSLDIAHQQAEPFPLERRAEAVEPDHVLAHIGLDMQHHRLAGRRQRGERARRAMRDIADAMHVDHAMVLADLLDRALELADHECPFAKMGLGTMRIARLLINRPWRRAAARSRSGGDAHGRWRWRARRPRRACRTGRAASARGPSWRSG